jgi:hypothetical protein
MSRRSVDIRRARQNREKTRWIKVPKENAPAGSEPDGARDLAIADGERIFEPSRGARQGYPA